MSVSEWQVNTPIIVNLFLLSFLLWAVRLNMKQSKMFIQYYTFFSQFFLRLKYFIIFKLANLL